MYKDIDDHIAKIRLWLDENILVYDAVQSVILLDFDMDWDKNYGSFYVVFNDQKCPMRFLVSIGGKGNGKISLQIPMFHSPLGAPASYQAIRVNDDVIQTIENALNDVFPPLKPLGMDKITGHEITMQTDFKDRIYDLEKYEAAKVAISQAGFKIKKAIHV